MLPRVISRKLAAARLKLRGVRLALAVARAVLAAALALVVVFVLDTVLEPPVRVVQYFALFMGVVAGVAGLVALARGLRGRYSDDVVALLVEREFPELGDGLVSSVQLARELEAGGGHTSQSMVQATIDRAAGLASGLNFGRVVRLGSLIPLWVLIVAFLGAGVVMVRHEASAPWAETFFRRVVWGEALGYPKLVALRVGRPVLEGVELERSTEASEGGAHVYRVVETNGEVVGVIEGAVLGRRRAAGGGGWAYTVREVSALSGSGLSGSGLSGSGLSGAGGVEVGDRIVAVGGSDASEDVSGWPQVAGYTTLIRGEDLLEVLGERAAGDAVRLVVERDGSLVSVEGRLGASRATFEAGDEVLEVAGRSAESADALYLLARYCEEGTTVPVLVRRGGETVGLRARVGSSLSRAVAKGDDVSVDVLVTKGASLVEGLVIHTRYEGQDGEEVRDLLKVGDSYFRKVFQNVTRSFRFYVEDPERGVRTPAYEVEVVQRPRVEQYEFVLDFPDYTAKPTQRVSQPDLQVPHGTSLTYLLVTNKPLQESWMYRAEGVGAGASELREGGALGAAPLPLEVLSADDLAPGGAFAALGPAVAAEGFRGEEYARRVLVGRLEVEGDVRFWFELLSREGYRSGDTPVVFTVRAVEDKRPQVAITEPGGPKQVTPQGKVPLVVEARDDYGIADVELRLVPRSADSNEEGEELPRVELPFEGASPKRLTLEHTLDMADLRLQPGDRLRYWAVAYDSNLIETQRARESRPYEIVVVRPEDLERILQDRLSALREKLEAAMRDQEEAREQAQAFVEAARPKTALLDEDLRQLQRVEYEQRQVTNRLEDVRDDLEEILRERRLNRLTEPGAMGLVEDLLAGVSELAERDSPAVSQQVNDVVADPLLAEATRTKLGRIPDLQEDLYEAIRALAARIDKWGDFTEVIQELRDVFQGQERVIEGTRQAIQQEHR